MPDKYADIVPDIELQNEFAETFDNNTAEII